MIRWNVRSIIKVKCANIRVYTCLNVKNIPFDMRAHWRLISACASAQSDPSLLCPHEDTLYSWLSKMRPVKLLIRLCECTGWYESSLGAYVRRYLTAEFDQALKNTMTLFILFRSDPPLTFRRTWKSKMHITNVNNKSLSSKRMLELHCYWKLKGWTALKWQILWETNKFQVSFCSPFKFVRRFFVENKRAIANNKGADQPARTRRLICAFIVRTCIKASFLSDSP